MPELPEVETIRRDLNEIIAGKKIKVVAVLAGKSVKNPTAVFISDLNGSAFEAIDRIGKLLIFKLFKKDKYLLVHLKMTGQLVYQKGKRLVAGGHSLNSRQQTTDNPPDTLRVAMRAGRRQAMIGGELPNKYTRVIIEFSDASKLYFNDLRRFGYLKIIKGLKELQRVKKGYGIEPLDDNFKLGIFFDAIKNRRTSIKAVLLDQKIIAGIGNIYADEILFQAGINPIKPACKINRREAEKIFEASREILKRAVKYRGTTFSDYVDAKGRQGGFASHLKVYGRQGKNCLSCGQVIVKKRIAQRGTHYCPNCQK